MLVLSRKLHESIVINGQITVKIVKIEGDQVRLGIDAPSDIPVHRQEVYEEIQRTNREALTQVRPKLPAWKRLPSPGPRPLETPGNDAPTEATVRSA